MDPAALINYAAISVQGNTCTCDLGDDGDVLLALLEEIALDDVALGHAALQVSVAAGVFQLA